MELNEKTLKKLQAELKKWFVANNRKLKVNRPILNTIHFAASGDVEMTNSHVAIRMKKVHSEPEHTIPDFGGYYPDMKRIFDSCENGSFQIDLEPAPMVGMLSPFKMEKVEVVKLTFQDDGIVFEPYNYNGDIIQRAKFTTPLEVSEPFNIGVNVKYMHDAMMFFKTQKIASVKMIASSPVRPMMFEFENLQYLVTPVRIGA